MSTEDLVEYKVAVSGHGVKKRCRKTDFHMFDFDRIPYGDFDKEELIKRAREEMNSKMRTWDKATLHLDRIVTENSDSDFKIQRWEPFSHENKKFLIAKEA